MKQHNIIGLVVAILSVFCLGGAAQAQAGEAAALHITCDESSEGALVSINGKVKGQCPFDIIVPAGTIAVRAVKPVGELRERTFEQSYLVGGGTRKPIEIILSSPQLTERGRALQEQAAREEAERKRVATEQAAEAKRIADEKEAAERKAALDAALAKQAAAVSKVDGALTALIEARRARLGTAASPCPDCPGILPGAISIELPGTSDDTLARWFDRVRNDILNYGYDTRAGLPAERKPLPCPSAEASIRGAVGLNDFFDRSLRARHTWRVNNGDIWPRPYVREVKIWPVKAACVDGKLDGDVEAWVSGNLVTGTSDGGAYAVPWLIKVNAHFTAGQADGELGVMARAGPGLYSDGIVRSQPYDALILHWVRDAREQVDNFSISVVLNRPLDPAIARGTALIITLIDDTKADGTGTRQVFVGKSFAYTSPIKDGNLHGWRSETRAEYKTVGGKTFVFSGQTVCSQKGVLVPNATVCPAD